MGDPAVGDADDVAAEAALWLVSVVAEGLLVGVAVEADVVDVGLLSLSRGDMIWRMVSSFVAFQLVTIKPKGVPSEFTLSITCIKPLLVLLRSASFWQRSVSLL